MTLPAPIPWQSVRDRLGIVFPKGIQERDILLRDTTAKVIFTALYVGAVEGSNRWIGPRHVVRMGDSQAARQNATDHNGYYEAMSRPKAPSPVDRWYSENSREQVRDETIRQGLVPNNAMVERRGVATTSPRGRYALQADFAALFHPALDSARLAGDAGTWRQKYLTPGALARVALLRANAITADDNVVVTCPGGGTVILPPGDSPAITKAVVEEFAPRFLVTPRVAWISDSAGKRPFRDASLERSLRIVLDAAQLLPDVILVDLDPSGRDGEVLLVFVEVAASDGPMTPQRQEAILGLIESSPARYRPGDAAFVTAYADRNAAPARRALGVLAWRSFAWFASEPDMLVQMHDGTAVTRKLAAL